ncbi:hypothetical protein N9985_01900 [Gammaproteobacteria bacterium]|jgi:hypothetical protein|nr:hypothetical protein [Gammaproteobacteria bacterium]
MSKPLTINTELYWANLSTTNQMSGKYQVDMSRLSDAAVEALEEQGFAVKNKDDARGNFITVKSTNPMRAYNTHGDEISCLVGNESKAKAVLGSYDWDFQGKKGRSPTCLKLVITDLNEYTAEGADIDINLEAAL